ncbi:HAD-IA family hydrolase [Candidatus Gracilibacteria bacterium]|nr:HAD-IA family hydrolase [Candidatus Gracilibacteria bacterium]
MSVKGVIFDADGVVINSELFSTQYQRQYNVTNEEMLPFYLGIFKETIVGNADLKEILIPWLPKWKYNKSVEEFINLWFRAEHSIDEKIVGSIKKIQAKGIKCFLATNQEKYRTKYMREEMGFDNIFDSVYSSCEIGFKKPDSEFYIKVLEKIKNEYKIDKNEIIFFDDSEKNVLSANDVGLKSYHYTNFQDYEKVINKLL